MSLLMRYVQAIATAQFYASEKTQSYSDRSAFYWGGRAVQLVPVVHAGLLIALLDMLAQALGLPGLSTPPVCLGIAIPFGAVMLFVGNDDDYLLGLRDRLRMDAPDMRARRMRASQRFTRNTYLAGAATIVAEIARYFVRLAG